MFTHVALRKKLKLHSSHFKKMHFPGQSNLEAALKALTLLK